MIFWKLNRRHKKLFLLRQLILLSLLLLAAIIALQIESVKLPTNASKVSASAGFIMVAIVFALAFFNRLGNIFKIKSVGFLIFFLLFLFLDTILGPLKVATGLMVIPLLLDDMIMTPIWMNIWYNEYDK